MCYVVIVEVEDFLKPMPFAFSTGRSPSCGRLLFEAYAMKEYATHLYKSRLWRATRAAYLKSVGGLCERCLRKGLYVPAEIVHHKIYITEQNINDAAVTLNWDNLEAVCRACHEEEHYSGAKRYKVNEDGSVIIR